MADMAQANAFLENVESLVTSKFNNVSELADESWGLTTQYLSDLSTEVANFTFSPMNLSWIISPITHGNYSPAMPVEPDMALAMPTTPVADALEEIVVDSVDVASLDAVAPLIVIPEDPDPDWPEDPGVAPNVSDVVVGAKPTYDIPAVPFLDDIVVLAPPEDEIPVLEATAPTFDVESPQSIFIYEEAIYSSSLKIALL